MVPTYLPTTSQLAEVFGKVIQGAGGTVSDRFDDGVRLFLRSILPIAREVRPKDLVQGGVALRVRGQQVLVHPYVFRQVCRNGAIFAQTIGSCRIELVHSGASSEDEEQVLVEVRDAVLACCTDEAFEAAFEHMHSAVDAEADRLLNLMPMLAHLPQHLLAQVLPGIWERFDSGNDRSRFGLMNAVTSLARDSRDPEQRWDLEELGGCVAANVKPVRSPRGSAALALRA